MGVEEEGEDFEEEAPDHSDSSPQPHHRAPIRQASVHWAGVRMVPPTEVPILVVFQVNDHLEVALDSRVQSLGGALQVALQERGMVSTQAMPSSSPRAVAGALAEDSLFAEEGHHGAGWGAPSGVAEIEEANRFDVTSYLASGSCGPGTEQWGLLKRLEDPAELERIACRPRVMGAPGHGDEQPAEHWLKARVAEPVWKPEESCWHAHKDVPRLPPERENRIFDTDWLLCAQKRHTSGSDKIPSEVWELLRELLRPHYPLLRHIYEKLSSWGAHLMKEAVFAVRGEAFVAFVRDIGLYEGTKLSRGSLDQLFIQCLFMPKDMQKKIVAHSKVGLIRFQFLELVVRLAHLCFGDPRRRNSSKEFGEGLVGPSRGCCTHTCCLSRLSEPATARASWSPSCASAPTQSARSTSRPCGASSNSTQGSTSTPVRSTRI